MSLRRVGTGLSALGICLVLCFPAQAAEKPLVVPMAEIDPADIAAGFCKGPAGSVLIREVLFLENRSIDWKTPTGTVRVWIEGDRLYTSDPADPSGGFTVVGINYLLEGNPDIVLKLVIHDGRLLVYWRETFQNRQFRQGLFAPPFGRKMTPLCEGKAGMSISH